MKTMKEQLADVRTVKKYWESSGIETGFCLTDAQALTWVRTYSEDAIHVAIDATARHVQEHGYEGIRSKPYAYADMLLTTAAELEAEMTLAKTAPAQEAR